MYIFPKSTVNKKDLNYIRKSVNKGINFRTNLTVILNRTPIFIYLGIIDNVIKTLVQSLFFLSVILPNLK